LEKLILEARRIYLGNEEEYAKGFYTRACYTSCVITLYAVVVSTKNFSVFGEYLWCILFTLKRFSVNFGYLGLKWEAPKIRKEVKYILR